MKTCCKCQQEKSENDFYINRKLGRVSGYCKVCFSKTGRAWHHKNKSISNSRRKELRLINTEKEKARNAKRRNDPKRIVSRTLYNAVQRGEIIRPNHCEKCGNIGKIHGHHFDYEKPFDVNWLCFDCHMNEHRKVKD